MSVLKGFGVQGHKASFSYIENLRSVCTFLEKLKIKIKIKFKKNVYGGLSVCHTCTVVRSMRQSWKHPELVLTPDLGWESKDFLETVAFQLRPEACLEWQNKEHSDRGMCTETGGESGAWP